MQSITVSPAWRSDKRSTIIDRLPVVDYYKNIQDHKVVSQVEPGYLRKILPTAAPTDGEPWDIIAKEFDSKILPGITHW